MMKEDSREYLAEQYKLAWSDFRIARSEDEQWEARKRLAKIEQTAIELYGNRFAEELRQIRN